LKRKYQFGSSVALGACVFALLLAASSRWPYFAYVLLRFVVCAVSLRWCYKAYRQDRSFWVWMFGGTALLFNPLFPMRMARSDWAKLNYLTAAFFIVALAVSLVWDKESSDRKDPFDRRTSGGNDA
jgi:hypothetical protein